MLHSTSTKSSSCEPNHRPSKTLQTSSIQIENHFMIPTCTEFCHCQYHPTDEQENNYIDKINTHQITSKRPRLTSNKRLQANARERERVHNLTAAFETLRQAIPIYGYQSKLSRLSILRIACSYVLVLGVLNDIDFSEGQNAYTLNESFHLLSSTIFNELKGKKPTNNRND